MCIQGKSARKNIPKMCVRKARKPLDVIHSDVVGKLKEPSIGGAYYLITFIDLLMNFQDMLLYFYYKINQRD